MSDETAITTVRRRGRPRKARPVREIPEGEARREQTKVNADALAAKAEADPRERGGVDPKLFRPINEILSFSHLASRITNALPDKDYAWVCKRAEYPQLP